MVFNKHDNLEGLHAPFGASKSSWLRYDDSKAIEVFKKLKAVEIYNEDTVEEIAGGSIDQINAE